MDYLKLKNQLQQNEFCGDFIIEVYRTSFPNLQQLVSCKEFVAGLLE